MMKNNYKGIIALWVAVFLWGIHGPSARFLTLHNISLTAVAESRFIIGTLIFFIYIIYNKIFIPLIKYFFFDILILSFFGVYLNSIFYHLGLKYIPATLVMILENLTPFFVIFFNLIIDKIKPSKITIISLLISFSGLFLIAIGKGGLDSQNKDFIKGFTFEIIAGITFGFYTYFTGKTIKKIKDNIHFLNIETINNENNSSNTINFKYTTENKSNNSLNETNIIINLLFFVFLISSILGLPLFSGYKNSKISIVDLIVIIQMGIFESGIAYILWNYGIHKTSSSKASILFLMTVVFTLINEVIFLSFVPSFILLIGGFLILTGSAIISLKKE